MPRKSASKAAKKTSRRKPKPDPDETIEGFMASVPEDAWAAMPTNMQDLVDAAAENLLTSRPNLANRPQAMARIIQRRLNAHARDVTKKHGREYARRYGWEPDPERCEQFMELLLKYLPLFIDMFAAKNPAVAKVLAMAA